VAPHPWRRNCNADNCGWKCAIRQAGAWIPIFRWIWPREFYRKKLRALQFPLEAANVTDRINVINFDSLFSGTAVGTPRMISARLRFTF
jgi:hypothetical protein